MPARLIMYAFIHVISMVFWEPNGRRLSHETPRPARRERRQLCLQARRGARREGCIYSLATVLGQIGQLCCCNTTTVYRNTVSLALNAFSHCIVVFVQHISRMEWHKQYHIEMPNENQTKTTCYLIHHHLNVFFAASCHHHTHNLSNEWWIHLKNELKYTYFENKTKVRSTLAFLCFL